MVAETYEIACFKKGNKVFETLKTFLKNNHFKHIYTTPNEIFKFQGRSGGRILLLNGFTVEAYQKKGTNSTIFLNTYSEDSPNNFPRNNTEINKIEINVIPPSKEISDLIESAMFSDVIDESAMSKPDLDPSNSITLKSRDNGKSYSFKLN